MDDTVFVRIGKTAADLHRQRDSGQRRHRGLFDFFRERLAFDVLHHEVGPPAVGETAIDDVNDIGVVELRDDQRFLVEQQLRLMIPEMLRGQELDRDGAIE